MTEISYEKLPLDLIQSCVRYEIKYPDHILDFGEITELLKEDVRSQILDVKKDLQFKYIGVRHPFSNTAI